MAVNGALDTHHDYDAANQVLGWGYDAAGNVITDTARSYTYDAINRLTSLTQGPEQRAYAYNGDGVVVSQTVNGVATLFTQDLAAPQSQVLQTQAGGATTDYLYGLDRLAAASGSTRTWYGADGQGSVRYLLDDAGDTRAPRSYDPFGTPEGAQMPDPFGYTGELQDAATGLLSLRARWYDPAAGQFFSRDPLESETGQAYSYAGDDPVNNSDPSGRCGEWFDLPHRASAINGACVSLAVYWAQVAALAYAAQDGQQAGATPVTGAAPSALDNGAPALPTRRHAMW